MIPTLQIGGLGRMRKSATNGGATHAYWRVRITLGQVVGQAYSSISGLEFRATAGGADQCTGGTAIADSFFGAGYEPAKAFDHDNSTEWASASGLPHYLGYQFAAPVFVAQVAMIATDAAYGAPNERPRDFTIEYSDNGSSWTVAATPAAQTGWTNSETRLFTVP